MKLVCQGAGGLGGQDWEGPHDLVGRLVLGHTALVGVWWVGPTVHYEDSTAMVRQPDYWVRPTHVPTLLEEGA
jgi:hypothetical protein